MVWLIARATSKAPVLRAQLDSRLKDLERTEEELADREDELRSLDREMARLEEANRHLLERVEQGQDDLAALHAHHRGEFATLARQIFDEQRKRFTEDLSQLEKNLLQAQNAYQAARNKLTEGRGNLVERSEKLRELGARASKSLPDSFQRESPPDR